NTPRAFIGTRKHVERWPFGALASVIACTITWLAQRAFVDQHFSPLITQPLLVRRATTSGLAASAPRPGSLRPNTNIRLPAARSGRCARFCASVPLSCRGLAPSDSAAPGVIATDWLW